MKYLASILLLVLIPMIVFSQTSPFGLSMGMTFDQIKNKSGKIPELVKDDYYTVIPPNTHDLFESYIIQISPTYSLVWIKAVGKDITTNGHGIHLKTAFDNLVSSVERTYGKYERIDFLISGSIWDEPNDFMMGLAKEERYLMANWEKEHDSTLPDDIKIIGVIANATSPRLARICLDCDALSRSAEVPTPDF